jgi:hypothetical protein
LHLNLGICSSGKAETCQGGRQKVQKDQPLMVDLFVNIPSSLESILDDLISALLNIMADELGKCYAEFKKQSLIY